MSTTRQNYLDDDGQLLIAPKKGMDPHPEYRLQQRADDEYTDRSVRSLWAEAEPAGWMDRYSYVRYHHDAELAIIARWKIIRTVVSPRGGKVEHFLRQQGVLGGDE